MAFPGRDRGRVEFAGLAADQLGDHFALGHGAVREHWLAAQVADLKGASPFRVVPVSRAWERELHGFGWLRHLSATEEEDAYDAARALAVDWIATHRRAGGVAYEPDVLARRIISWIALWSPSA